MTSLTRFGAACLLLCAGCALPGAVDSDDARQSPAIVNQPLSEGQRAELQARLADVPPRFELLPLFTDLPGKRGSHAPSIAADAAGQLYVAWYAYAGPHELDGAELFMASRAAEAAGWSPPRVVRSASVALGNPVLFADAGQLWLFYAAVPGGWSTARIELVTSVDAGATWSAAHIISSALGSNVRNPPVRLADGALLLPAYDDLLQRGLFFVSDEGQAWRLRSRLTTPFPDRLIQPAVVPGDDDALLLVGRNSAGGGLWVGQSDDAGASWRVSQAARFPNPDSAVALLRLSSGELVMVFNNDPAVRRELSITLSPDLGRSWTTPRALLDSPGEFAYPAIAQSPDGDLHVVYSHDRRWIGYARLNLSWIVGLSGASRLDTVVPPE